MSTTVTTIRKPARTVTVTETTTETATTEAPPTDPGGGGCSPDYEGACVPVDAGDVNCGDIPEQDFSSVGSDPYGLDRDSDGVACES